MNRIVHAMHNSTIRIAFMFIVVSLVAGVLSPRLGTISGAGAVFDRATIVGIMALGLTVCLVAGQIDLSIGANVALSGVVAMSAQALVGSLGGMIAGVVAGVLLGVINAAAVVLLKLPSLIATLATMLAVRSLALTVTGGKPVSGNDVQLALLVDRYLIPGVTLRTAVWLVIAIVLAVLLIRSRVGRNLYAVGGDSAAARTAGIPADKYVAGAIVVSGAMGGLAGVLLAVSLNTGSPVVGDSQLLIGVAAAVIGGATLTGGRGSAFGAVLGVLTITVAVVSMEFAGVIAYMQQIVTGVILVVVLIVDRLTSVRT